MENLLSGFLVVFQPANMAYLLLGCFVGLIIGILPGLGPIFSITLFLPFTFGMRPETAMILLMALHTSTAYGGGITSILMNIPGGPNGMAVMLDGFPMTQQGKAGDALGALQGSSLFGSFVGVLLVITIAPQVSEIALKLGPAEYFMLALFGLSLVAMIGSSRGSMLKGLILGLLGLIASCVGRDSTTSSVRYAFGITYLEDGIQFIPAAIGLFALSQIMQQAVDGSTLAGETLVVTSPWNGIRISFQRWWCALKGSLVGAFFAAAPGIGIATASMMAYLVESRTGKDRKSYGKGNINGVIAAQAATNATTGGELIPALSLGIPGGPCSAVFIAALTLHGMQPGLNFFRNGGIVPYAMFAGIIVSTVVFFVMGLISTPVFARISQVPNTYLIPTVIACSAAGAYAARYKIGDLIFALVFCVVGYYMRKYKWPMQCFVLGMVLGTLAEANFNRALLISQGNYATFVTRPVSLVLLLIIAFLSLWSYLLEPMIKARKTEETK